MFRVIAWDKEDNGSLAFYDKAFSTEAESLRALEGLKNKATSTVIYKEEDGTRQIIHKAPSEEPTTETDELKNIIMNYLQRN